jgi:hypothetical protein
VFDESPTPDSKGFSQAFQLRIFRRAGRAGRAINNIFLGV